MNTIKHIKKLLLMLIIFNTSNIFAEQSIQGQRLPRLTTAERDQIQVAGNPSAKGLLIYNIDHECLEFWDGTRWADVWLSDGNEHVDSTDYIGTNNDADLIIKTNSNERVRIDKDGKVFLRNVGRAPENVAQLAIDNTTGEVFAIKTETNVNPMNYLQYVITTAEGDWIRNFNTRIPVSDSTLIVVGSSFKNGTKQPAALKLSTSAGQQLGTFSSQEVLAFEEGGTWRLKADYIDSNPGDGANGTWTIYCIAINNSLVQKFAPQIHTMTYRDDSASRKPAGL
jgi:hypothetical protein